MPEVILSEDPVGGKCDVKTLRVGGEGSLPTLQDPLPTPTREGYDFKGWFRKGFETPVKDGEVFTAPETITAKWVKKGLTEQKPVRVDFDPDGGAITEWKGKKVPPEGRTAPLHGGQ